MRHLRGHSLFTQIEVVKSLYRGYRPDLKVPNIDFRHPQAHHFGKLTLKGIWHLLKKWTICRQSQQIFGFGLQPGRLHSQSPG